jgi:hypothetical protein
LFTNKFVVSYIVHVADVCRGHKAHDKVLFACGTLL